MSASAESPPRVLLLSKEYPPHIYGGAGVHVENLARELARLTEVEVRCFGEQREAGGAGRPRVQGFSGTAPFSAALDGRLRKALEPLATDLAICGAPVEADVVHCHTWYSMQAGLWIKTLYDIPLVITTHSLEPLRPWKEEQLGRGYHLSSWMERSAILAADAVIAVSEGTRREVCKVYPLDPAKVHVVHNGIQLERYLPQDPRPALERYRIDPAIPYVLFVGRITRQKGVLHLIEALRHVGAGVQVVLCAGAPDTPEIGAETARAVEHLRRLRRDPVHWIPEMVPVPEIIRLYSGAAVFVCPSVYEPFGIINLEAMACKTPVVASRVGGIPEVVVEGETGYLVHFEQNPPPDFTPKHPERFARDLAAAIHKVIDDPGAKQRLGEAGRRRVEKLFSWESVARRTLELYRRLMRERDTRCAERH
jgi:glycogen synthase